MIITLLLLFHPFFIAAYNLDVRNVVIYAESSINNQSNQTSSSFFGYTVLLSSHKRILSNGSFVAESWMFVGAPKADYERHLVHENKKIPNEPGGVYRCRLPGKCLPINVKNPDDEIGYVQQVERSILITKENGWFGATMTLQESSDSLTVCAPKTIARVGKNLTSDYQATMQGICYTGKLYSGSLQMEDKNIPTYDFFKDFWYNPVNGFAAHYTTSKANVLHNSVRPIIGSPKHESFGSVHRMGNYRTIELPNGDDVANFGYALTSGYYFHEEQLMVAAGAPGWQYVGQVAILKAEPDLYSVAVTIKGKEVGEYFGASLATGDMNKDGLDDLIVGAPHWNNDNGRVYIFLGTEDKFSEADILLEGSVDDGLYGYAMTCGDIDGDGFADLIVGAPWEGSGVIYVYNGDAKLQDIDELRPSQKIMASEIRTDILRFGFSFSKPVDIDGNGFSDIAVGAYASGHAVILRSKPAVKAKMALSTFPKTLPRNATHFVLIVCLDHSSHFIDQRQMWDAEIIVKVDEDHKRVNISSDQRISIKFFNQRPSSCRERTIKLKKNIHNHMDVIQIDATHQFSYDPQHDCAGNVTMGSLCPIEYKARFATAQMKLSFDIGCGIDAICNPSTSATLDFQGISNSTWIIGSNNVSLVLSIGNHGEPAYFTTVTIDIPNRIHLRRILPSCQEEKDSETLRVTCDVGNPLETGTMKNISLDLDMTGLRNGSLDGTTLNFPVEINTRGVNRGISATAIQLNLKADVSVGLSGKAYEHSYYLKYNESSETLRFQHIYQISRFGPTRISKAFLTIKTPYKFDDLEFLAIAKKPRVSILGRSYECSVIGVSVMKTHFVSKSPSEVQLKDFLTIEHDHSSSPMDSQSSDKITPAPFYTSSESNKMDITYINCSSVNVTCGLVVCEIHSLKSTQDVANLQLQLVVNHSRLNGEADGKGKIIQITTEASVEVVDPNTQFIIPGTGIWVPVTTTLLHGPNVRTDISIWIILGSVLMGLLTLCIVAIVLWRIGFFKRNRKEELDDLKTCENVLMQSKPFSEK